VGWGESLCMQRYTILLFGPAATTFGQDRVTIEAQANCSCGQLKAKMGEQYPSLAGFVEAGRLAVNQAFVGEDEALEPGAEIALISMVSGG
jgi:molybdopterin converting factor small subunit